MSGEWILQWLWMPVLAAVAVQDVRAAVPPPRIQIRVRLAEAVPMVALRGYDLRIFALTGKDFDSRKLASTADRSTSWEIRCQNDRVRALQAGTGRAIDLASPVVLESRSGFIQFRNRPYRDEVRIRAVGSLCEVVNRLGIEKYLDGLVNAEFNSHWNEEAIAAQVIAARTYALFQIRQSKEIDFDVDATVRDQVYDGSFREDTRASRAVEKTRGMVLTLRDGKTPLKAFYHSTCAGHTELPERVWGASYPGFTRIVEDPYCSRSPAMNWELDVSAREVSDAILRGARSEESHPGWPADWLGVVRDGKLLDLRVTKLDRAGRVEEVLTTWVQGSAARGQGRMRELSVSGARLRDWLGPGRFRSASFQVVSHRSALGATVMQRWHFQGKGNGHGVGMCQYGAKTMGEKGFRTAAILRHYYPDAILSKLW